MRSLSITQGQGLHILCLGAHCDDIEIGCGATLLSLMQARDDISITWVVLSSDERRRQEASAGAKAFCEKSKSFDIKIYDFRDGFLPYDGAEVKNTFESLKREIQYPDVIFTHFRHDLHQDHRLVSELTWNTFRNHLVLEYEIPKWDGDIGSPNHYFPVDDDIAKQKISLLQQIYNSQKNKAWFTDDLFWSIMRIRGMECNSPSRLAEAFYGRKISLGI